ncbi:hypothetical protein T01_11252 [Trichinella spiralis]|uniref:CCHC-type domain-containing protein n=1 Tax=Trichinella spiralis TaxID=6334 RepID=A0A0V1BZI4_TRISP|nr:hypothetical protein T01_11252 [Trichinella spiralis]
MWLAHCRGQMALPGIDIAQMGSPRSLVAAGRRFLCGGLTSDNPSVTDVTARLRLWEPANHRIIVNFGITSKIVEASDLRIVNTTASAAKVRSKKLAANEDRLNQLLAELEELCLESADVREIKEQISLTETIYHESDAFQGELVLDLDGEERQSAIEDWSKWRKLFRQRKSRACAIIEEAHGNRPMGIDSDDSCRPAVRAGNGRLPEMKLLQFSGKVLEFPTFWAQFEASIHNRSDLDAATKFTYLISSTEGRARSSIEGIPLTAANYPQAVSILKTRFGRPRMVVREHLTALWKLPACSEMSMRGIQSLVDEVTKHLRCLVALNKDPFASPLPLSESMMPMVRDKFPLELLKAWDTNIGPDPGEDEDNLQKFLEFAQWQANLLTKPLEEDGERSVGRSEHRRSPRKLSRSTWKNADRVTSSAAALAVAALGNCPFCEGKHKGAVCEKFTRADRPRRMVMARSKGVCFKCLEAGHLAKNCRENRTCAVDGCEQTHHELLHSSTPRESANRTEPSSVQRGMLAKGNGKGALLQIVRARAYGPDGTHAVVNCLLDTGAQVSFIRKDIAEALGLTGFYEKVRLESVGGSLVPQRRLRRVEFSLGADSVADQPALRRRVEALAIPRICGKIPHSMSCSLSNKDKDAAQTEVGQQSKPQRPLTIDILIGVDHYYDFVTGRMKRNATGSIALETLLGWIICGKPHSSPSKEARVLLTKVKEPTDAALRKFWEIEAMGITPEDDVAPEDTRMMERFEKSLSFNGERYQVGLLLSEGQPDLPVNVKQAMRRLTTVERRLAQSDKDSCDYSSTMRRYLVNGWAEPATESGPPKRTWYLPHHAVYKGEGEERKCRVVFDGSARYGETSLNSQLEAGPPIQMDLLRLSFAFAASGLAYRRILKTCTSRFKSEKKTDTLADFSGETRHKRFATVSTVRVHARRHQATAPRAASEVLCNMYVDDLATSCESPDEARTLATQLEELMASGGFHLHKWASNEPAALRAIPTERRSTETRDHLSFIPPRTPSRDGRDSKRQMLSTASSIFDPMGFLAPFMDEPLPDDVDHLWVKWKQELEELPLITVPRALVPVALVEAKRVELHAFCDASELAYGAVIYLRVEASAPLALVSLVTAKSRVAPIKRLNLPRLELMGALVAARLVHYTQRALSLPIHSITCWCDSEVALSWVRSAASRWKPFVRNRVEEIQQLVEPASWRHCSGKDNPADWLNRGVTVTKLAEGNVWWHGPTWLARPQQAWPRRQENHERNPLIPPGEERTSKHATCTLMTVQTTEEPLHPGRYGDIKKLFRISAYCRRFAKNCRSSVSERHVGNLTAWELHEAEEMWVRRTQEEEFQAEIQALVHHGRVAEHSRISQLDPYLDERGVLRAGGRLGNLDLPASVQHPAVFPGNHDTSPLKITRRTLLAEWGQGPTWLRGSPETWPEAEREERIKSLEVFEKERRTTAVLVTVSPPQDTVNVINPGRYSSFERLIRVTAWCRRFRHSTTLPASSRRTGTGLTLDELKEAERIWIRQEQIHAFSSKESLDKAMTKMLCGLNPFLDEFGVLRVGGRLGRAQLEEETKFPALLPRKGMIVDLLIRREHNRQLHAGVAHTLAALRERFWILRGRTAVKRVLRTCGICRRVAARPFRQRMGDLPAIRVNPARPFSNVGIDFVGTLLIRSESSKYVSKKAYIFLFTCMVVRAIHLELVPDQTIERFLRALRRFVTRRGSSWPLGQIVELLTGVTGWQGRQRSRPRQAPCADGSAPWSYWNQPKLINGLHPLRGESVGNYSTVNLVACT